MAAIPVSAERRPTMKKNAKRLSLSRETLRHLQNEQLETAAGGVATTRPICCADTTSCPPPTGNGDTCLC
jgi:hypothetical protein